MPLGWGNWNKGASMTDASVPEALRGKSPEEIAAELVRLSAAVTEVDALKTQLSEKGTELTQVQERIRALEGTKSAAPKAADAPKELTSVLVDEDAAFNERLAPVINGVMTLASQNAKMLAESRIRQNSVNSRLLTKYQAAVDALYATVPVQYQQYPETYERIFKQVLGDHLDELLQEQAKGDGSLFVESNGGRPPEIKSPEGVLTKDEEETARKMKITPEDMLAAKKQMHSAGGHISFGHPDA